MGEAITKEHLKKYKGWKVRVALDLGRIAEAKSAAEFRPMRESDGSKHNPSASDGMGGAIRWMELKDRLLPAIEENQRKMEQIERAIDRLDDPMEQSVLIARYIAGEGSEPTPWAAVAMKIYRRDDENAVQNATRLHGRALVSIAKEEI